MLGLRVMLDRDLAAIYGVKTGRLNEAVKRNADRFPGDFMFQLSRGYNVKHLPYAFTEHGAIQAANVLNSPRAVTMGIHVVRAFVQLRDLLASNRELARKFAELERKLATHDQAITGILKAIQELMNPPAPRRRGIGFTADF
ncbi:ORF6N domain-containing protein [Steroidobacter sp.]|uniref:ORF6N domain-containing protein n=1 Tax=Steroidobacter sp. TaxID=1978227 RepID=UPI0025CC6FF3